MNNSSLCFVWFVLWCLVSTAQNTESSDGDLKANSCTDPRQKSKLESLVARAQDPSYHCTQEVKTSKEGPLVFVNIDCGAEGARWDYNYQVKLIFNSKAGER